MLDDEAQTPFDSTTALDERISDLLDGAQVFLATHPMVIGIRNNISIALGEGGTIGFMHPIRSINEIVADILSLT